MQVRAGHDRLLLRIDRGEEIVSSILTIASQRDLGSGVVMGIGALEDAELGFYLLDERRYLRRTFPGIRELVSMQGNLARLEGASFLHAHVVLGAQDYSTVGGHLFRGVVAVVAEVVVFPGSGNVLRGMDEPTGLNLWQL